MFPNDIQNRNLAILGFLGGASCLFVGQILYSSTWRNYETKVINDVGFNVGMIETGVHVVFGILGLLIGAYYLGLYQMRHREDVPLRLLNITECQPQQESKQYARQRNNLHKN